MERTITKSAKTVATSTSKKSSVYSKYTSSNDFVMLPDGTLVPAKDYKKSMRDQW